MPASVNFEKPLELAKFLTAALTKASSSLFSVCTASEYCTCRVSYEQASIDAISGNSNTIRAYVCAIIDPGWDRVLTCLLLPDCGPRKRSASRPTRTSSSLPTANPKMDKAALESARNDEAYRKRCIECVRVCNLVLCR